MRPPTIAAVVIALCSSSGLLAQSPKEPSPPPSSQTPDQRPPTFRTESNFVRVDVYPTRDGQPVLDLKAADFEIGRMACRRRSRVRAVVVRPAGTAERAGRAVVAARDAPGGGESAQPGVRDLPGRTHVPFESSQAITEPLIRLINRILGPDDLVGIMTPDMSASEIVLARRTEVTEERLRTHWRWGDRFAQMNDEREDAYTMCYPRFSSRRSGGADDCPQAGARDAGGAAGSGAVLSGVREERKAVLTVTQGWDLFRPKPRVRESGDPAAGNPPPGVDPVGVGPDGTLTTKDPRDRNKDTNNSLEQDGVRRRSHASGVD